MGQSADAILFYGYCWDDETELWDNDRYDNWVEALSKRRGHTSPWDFYRDSGAEASHSLLPYRDQQAAYEAWKYDVGFAAMLAEWDSVKSAIRNEHPNVDVSSHCSVDYPIPYIYIKDTRKRAWQGEPVSFDPLTMAREEDNTNWQGWLAMFVEALDIDVSKAQGPGWFLVSDWG